MTNIRACQPEDAAAFLSFSQKLDDETSFMLLEPEEREITLDQQRDRLEDLQSADHERLLVAADEQEIVGFVAASRKPFKRVRHCFYLVIGVSQAHWGYGVGSSLMVAVEDWAKSVGAKRLELSVVASNARAIALYKKCGFLIEGTRRSSMKIDDEYVDELHLGKLL